MPRLSALLFLALAPWLAQAEETLRVYNWNDYIDPQVLESFQKDTGIRVEYHTFATAEELDKALRSGEAIDVAVPSHDTLPALLKDNLLRPLDFTQLPNRSHLDRQLLSKLAAVDPDNRHAVPYLWGAVGLAINTPQAEAAYGGPLPNSWSLLFDASQSQRLKSCGISLLDAPDETLAILLNYQGRNLGRTAPSQVRRAAEALHGLRPNLRYVDSERYIADLEGGRLCLAMAWVGDALRAAKAGQPVSFEVPQEGSVLFIDNLVIPRPASTRGAPFHRLPDATEDRRTDHRRHPLPQRQRRRRRLPRSRPAPATRPVSGPRHQPPPVRPGNAAGKTPAGGRRDLEGLPRRQPLSGLPRSRELASNSRSRPETRHMQPTSPTRKPRASSQARIAAILDAARGLLADEGIGGLTIYSVAERAEMPPSSVYHFFPSVPALLQGLTGEVHAAFRACLEQPVDHAGLRCWRDLSRIVEERMLAVYARDAAARQLILASHGLAEVTQADRQHDVQLGQAMRALFERHFLLPPLPTDIEIFSLAMELGDRVYALSVQRHGIIDARLAEEGMRVFDAYLGLYLPPILEKRSEPLTGFISDLNR